MVLEKVIVLLAEILGLDVEDITEDTLFTKEYQIAPIDVANLVIKVENALDVVINDDEAYFFQSVKDVVAYVEGQLDN